VANLLDQHTELDNPAIGALEALVDPVEALVDPVEAPVDPVEALVDLASHLVEVGAGLRIHAGNVPDAPWLDNVRILIRFTTPSTEETPMSVKRINAGPRMSGAVVNGDTVYLAGQVAEGATVKAQTEAILKKIDDLLGAAGSSKANLLSTVIYLSDIRTFDEMNAVWDAWVSPGNTPARATVEARLANPKYLVEIMVTAAV
jgi:enamine deaminase RidA (YjgF/YER057c/UK114 family)